MKINRNMSAVRANKQLLGTENRLTKSMKRLSSGYKINSAEDNPAGMAISNKMKAQYKVTARWFERYTRLCKAEGCKWQYDSGEQLYYQNQFLRQCGVR